MSTTLTYMLYNSHCKMIIPVNFDENFEGKNALLSLGSQNSDLLHCILPFVPGFASLELVT